MDAPDLSAPSAMLVLDVRPVATQCKPVNMAMRPITITKKGAPLALPLAMTSDYKPLVQ